MMIIPFWERLSIKKAGKKDAKGSYGRTLYKSSPIKTLNYPSSQYMTRLVDNYFTDLQSVISRDKYLLRLYLKIIRNYENIKRPIGKLQEANNRIADALQSKKEQIKTQKTMLENARRNYSEANSTGIIKPESGVKTLYGLEKDVQLLKSEIEELEQDVIDQEKELISSKNEYESQKHIICKKINNYIYDYKKGITSLVDRLKRLEMLYDERLDIYWSSFLDETQMIAARKTLDNLCKEQGKNLFSEKMLYPNERAKVNSIIADLEELEINV